MLGVGPHDDWPAVQRAYREQMRRSHPDVAGAASTTAAARANAAYARLGRARHEVPAEPTVEAPAEPTARSTGVPTVPAGGPTAGPAVTVLDGDTIHLDCPADEALALLVEATHTLGEVTYLDRSCSIFEAMVPVAGEGPCSLVVTLQGRADGTDAFCTLEALRRVAQPPVGHVVAALAQALARR